VLAWANRARMLWILARAFWGAMEIDRVRGQPGAGSLFRLLGHLRMRQTSEVDWRPSR
jgi:hypothetical protein